jgi:peptide chain release factor 1
MDLAALVGKRREHLAELEFRMGQPDFFDDPARAARCTREHRRLQSLVALWDERENVARALTDNRQLAKGDDELAEMAAEEIPDLEARLESLDQETRYALLPRDAAEDRDAILEIRAGTGGDEAALFAGDLLRMYSRYAEKRGWRAELMEASPSEAGGFKEAIARVSGEEVFRWLKYESGVHRVQRVPATEAQGRIHTSTATVAVLPEAEEVDVALRSEDLRIDVCRSGGAGGQHVNRTESAVQILHLPTGLMVRCEDGRSQGKNKEKALMLLRAKLLERERGQQAEAYSEHRRKLIGSGGREEKIRTYNFPQNRVTDHRIGLTLYNLDTVMEGAMDPLIHALQASEMADRLHELAG